MPRSGPHQLKPDPRGINPYDGLLSTGQGTPQTFGAKITAPILGLFFNGMMKKCMLGDLEALRDAVGRSDIAAVRRLIANAGDRRRDYTGD